MWTADRPQDVAVAGVAALSVALAAVAAALVAHVAVAGYRYHHHHHCHLCQRAAAGNPVAGVAATVAAASVAVAVVAASVGVAGATFDWSWVGTEDSQWDSGSPRAFADAALVPPPRQFSW